MKSPIQFDLVIEKSMATDAATGGNREARRRRILEQGSDRLALITGRIQSLPPDPDQSRSSARPPGQTPDDIAQHENASSNSPFPDHETDEERIQLHNFDNTNESLLETSDKAKSISSKPVASLGVEEEQSQISEEQSQISSSIQIPTQANQTAHSHRDSFTISQISSAITASENIRMYCSAAAAILVTLSHIEFPILGSRIIRGASIFKPLYLLLLTNISIVLARLISQTQGSELRKGQTSSVLKFSGDGLVDQLGRTLELGLMLQKIFEAMFIDFGIYVTVLICGFSLVRILGW